MESDPRGVARCYCEWFFARCGNHVTFVAVCVHRVGRTGVRASIARVEDFRSVSGTMSAPAAWLAIRSIHVSSERDYGTAVPYRRSLAAMSRDFFHQRFVSLGGNNSRDSCHVRCDVVTEIRAVRSGSRARRFRVSFQGVFCAYAVASIARSFVARDVLRLNTSFRRLFVLL